MQLTHTLDLPAPVDQVFGVFGRLDLLSPCFPGASVWGRDGEVYHGAVKIKFGPFPLVFEGTARVVRVDVAQQRLVVKANARDRRGAAAGAATVTATFRPSGATATTVEVLTELDLTGRPAQLGTGAITSVSDRLKEQFAGCIGPRLAHGLSAVEQDGRVEQQGGVESAAEPTPSPARAPRSGYAYAPPAGPGDTPHLQVLPDLARTWLPWVAAGVGGLAVLLVVARSLRRLRGRRAG